MALPRHLVWATTHWRVLLGLLVVLVSIAEAHQGWLWENGSLLELYGGTDREMQLSTGDDRKWMPPPWALLYLLGNLIVCWGIHNACRLKRQEVEASLDVEDPYPPGTQAATPWYPRFIFREMVVAIGVVGIILILASLLNPSQFFEPSLDEDALLTIEAPADPFETPPGILPEWYFITSYFLLKIMPAWVALVVVMGLFIIGLILVPFLDNRKQKHPLLRPAMTMTGYMVVSIWLMLTFIGEQVLEWRPWEWAQ